MLRRGEPHLVVLESQAGRERRDVTAVIVDEALAIPPLDRDEPVDAALVSSGVRRGKDLGDAVAIEVDRLAERVGDAHEAVADDAVDDVVRTVTRARRDDD